MSASSMSVSGTDTGGRGGMLQNIKHINVVIHDFDRSMEFYQGLLTMKCVHGPFAAIGKEMARAFGITNTGTRVPNAVDVAAFLRWTDDDNDAVVDLGWWQRPPSEGEPYRNPNNVGHQRIAFRVRGIDEIYETLKEKGVKFNAAPLTLELGESVRMCCFTDPDGVRLALLEPSSAAHDAGSAFERIFYVSTCVRDLDASLRLYQDALGMSLVGEPFSLKGPEVAQLFGVSDTSSGSLRGAWLRPGTGDYALVELLQWIEPASTGKPYDVQTAAGGSFANHVGIPRVAFNVRGIHEVHDSLVSHGLKFVSPPQVTDIGPDVAYCCFTNLDGTILQLYEYVRGTEREH